LIGTSEALTHNIDGMISDSEQKNATVALCVSKRQKEKHLTNHISEISVIEDSITMPIFPPLAIQVASSPCGMANFLLALYLVKTLTRLLLILHAIFLLLNGP
jgi:hypothetical protein